MLWRRTTLPTANDIERWAENRKRRVYGIVTDDGVTWLRHERSHGGGRYEKLSEADRSEIAAECAHGPKPDHGWDQFNEEVREATRASPVLHDSPYLTILRMNADLASKWFDSKVGKTPDS